MSNLVNDRTKVLQAAQLSRGDILVVVEGRDDRDLLEKLVPGLVKGFAPFDRIRIRAAEDLLEGRSGCSAVTYIVNQVMADADFVTGIVDRDSLRDDERQFFETDDVLFSKAQFHGPKISIWNRCELECYLLDPCAISTYCLIPRGSRDRDSGDFSREKVFARMLGLIPAVALFSAFNLSVRKSNQKSPTVGNEELKDGWHLPETLSLHGMQNAMRSEPRWYALQQDTERWMARMLDMAGQSPVESEEAFRAALRVLNGKAFLERVMKLLGQTATKKVKNSLASFMGSADPEQGRVPDEIPQVLGYHAASPGLPRGFR